MKNEEAIEILTKNNAWRRGDDTHSMVCVKQLGLAIDHAIEVLRADNPIADAMRENTKFEMEKEKRLFRDQCAMSALQGIITNEGIGGLESFRNIARCSYELADAMLESRNGK